jgi:CBS domain containing-hemolysin-like protein
MKRFDFETYGDDGFDDEDDEDQEDKENNFIDSQMVAMQLEQNILIEHEIQAKLIEEAYKICKGSWMWYFMSIPQRMKKVKIVYEEIKKIISE